MKKKPFLFFVIVLSFLFGCQTSQSQGKHTINSESLACQNTIESVRLNATQKFSDDAFRSNAKVVFKPEAGYDTKEYNWYFMRKGNNSPPDGADDNSYYKKDSNTSYIGNPSEKVLFLTFDQGYENGFTPGILDTLKKHSVKAAFFCVKPYLTSNQALIRRMVEEGHLVCNHSSHHPSMAKIKDFQQFKSELTDVEQTYEEITGRKMPKYFRPPMGKYSELSLKYTKDCGYKTIFWSFAYMDWKTDSQPDCITAKKKMLDRVHNGAIILLHSVSKTNAEILDEVIVELKKQGYVFKTLDEL